MRPWNFIVLTAGALLSVACSNANPGTGVCGRFTSELRIEDKFGQESTTFTAGEPINFKMRITNNGDSPASLSYDGCPSIRFVVSDTQRQTVFDSLPPNSNCTAVLRSVDYQPKQTQEFAFQWNQTRDSDGSQVPPGRYTADARDRSVECAGALERSRDFSIQ